MTKSLFPLYDPRNPKYYEKRASYPLPDDAWYRNSDQTGRHVPMTFSKENFVRGFNLTVGEYYQLRDFIIPLLRVDDIYTKDFRKDMDAKFECWYIWSAAEKHPLLQHEVHPKWHHDMLWKWISSTARWIEKHDVALREGRTPDKDWKWGPDSVTPKSAPSCIPYHRLRIKVVDQAEKFVVINVRDLQDGNIGTSVTSPEDLDPQRIRLRHLRRILSRDPGMSFDDKTSQLRWESKGEYIVIENNVGLVTAITELRANHNEEKEIDEVTLWATEFPDEEDE